MSQTNNNLWPGWETVGSIGSGSFGTVYEIQRDVFDEVEKAALKVISIPQNASDIEEMYSDGYDDESITSTFQNHLKSIVAEYSLMRRMNGSSNIVNCDDVRYVQHDDGIGWDIFIKMELLTPLTKALPNDVPEETVVRIAKDMCTALELCRKHGIVHRDIKPQNIFVSPNGDYKLGDFGVAKTMEKTMGGTKIGTYKYMAPEVYHNQPYGSAADIYSLGLVLYWMLNERRMPFMPLPPAKMVAGQDEQARHRRLSGEAIPAPAHGSNELKQIVLKACAYDPKDRYASALVMLNDLEKLTGSYDCVSGSVDDVSDHTEWEEDTLTEGPVFKPEGKKYVAADDEKTSGPVFQPQQAHKTQTDVPSYDSHRQVYTIMVALGILGVIVIVTLLLVFKCEIFGHKWEAATCTAARVCTKCGKTSGEPAEHVFTPATCTSPRTCHVCGKTDGVPPGHKWNKATCTAPKTCQLCGLTEGSALEHSWTEATCTDTKTCQLCGAKDGDVLGHDWIAATCTTASKCQRCGASSGEPAGHTWVNATFTEPKTCSTCGKTLGNPIDYSSVSVENQVLIIRERYNALMSNLEAGKYRMVTIQGGIEVYYDSNDRIVSITVHPGTNGIGSYSNSYKRRYFYYNGELFFATFEGDDAHRFYFYEELVMRWRYSNEAGTPFNHDFAFTTEYKYWESLVLGEANKLMDMV